jgi:hypothetical protein
MMHTWSGVIFAVFKNCALKHTRQFIMSEITIAGSGILILPTSRIDQYGLD